jgi:hypothetical protein
MTPVFESCRLTTAGHARELAEIHMLQEFPNKEPIRLIAGFVSVDANAHRLR